MMKLTRGVCVGAAIGLFSCAVWADGTGKAPVRFVVEAKSLRIALNEWAEQAGLSVIWPAGQAEAVGMSRRVEGELAPEKALDLLLEGSGLSYTFVDAYTVAIRSADERLGKRTAFLGASEREDEISSNPSKSPGENSGKDAQQTPATEELQEIVVTGTHIRGARADNAASPLTIYDRVQIERLGITTAGEILRAIPSNQGNASTSPYGTLGASHFPNLRGLGEGTTLVLINGQRPASSAVAQNALAGASQFNLDTIPVAAIERIEVLRDGASAIYGSDAIGGVINVILRRDFRGVEASVKHSAVTSGDFTENNYSGVAGGQLGRLSTMLSVEYFERGALLGKERPYSAAIDKTPFGGSSNDFLSFLSGPVPAMVSALADSGNLPGLSSAFAANPTGAPRSLQVVDFLSTQGKSSPRSDFTAFQTVVVPQNRASAFWHLDLALTQDWTASADILYSKSNTRTDNPGPFVNKTLAAGNPFNPFGVDTLVSFYLLGLPAGTHGHTETEDRGLTVGIAGKLFEGWQVNASGYLAKSRLREAERTVDEATIEAALIATDPAAALNPFFNGYGTSPALIQTLSYAYLEGRTDVRAQGGSIAVNGPVLSLPAGQAHLALGAEARNEKLGLNELNLFSGPRDIHEGRDVRSAYVELGIPLLHTEDFASLSGQLDLSLAARHERYSDFGDTTNPKIGLRWRPTRHLTFRGTWGTAYQAPNLSQLFSVESVFQGSESVPIDDPILNETYQISNTITFRGNPDLQPQEADTFTIGLSYEHQVGYGSWNASADVYRINFTDRIRSAVDNQELVDLESSFPQLVVRDPVTQRITDLISAPVNLASVETSGIDVSASYAMPLWGGQIDASVSGTLVDRYDVQVAPIAPLQDRRSFVGFSNRFKSNLQLQYSRAAWSASATIFHANAYRSDVQPEREIRSQRTMDLQFTYHCCGARAAWLRDARLIVGVINVFDRAPPFYDNFQGFEFGEGDPLQRRVYAKLTAAF